MEQLPFSKESLAKALDILRNGGVIAHATETCYGLACDLSNATAVEKLFRIKMRPFDQPVSALFASVDEAKKVVEWNERAEELAAKHLPGPLTMILKMKKDAKLFPVVNGGETIGIRVSSHPHAEMLAKEFGKPISTTSANVHGLPNPYSVEDMESQFAGKEFQPDLLLDDGKLPGAAPSKIINLTTPEEQILRP